VSGSLAAQGASLEETAAIMAAIERFRNDTAPPPRRRGIGAAGGWLRAARLEDAGGGAEALTAWGDPHPWGRPDDA